MEKVETEPPNYRGDHHPISEKGKELRNLVEADLLDDRYATTTKRGLKNRHVQLMALGGTIGTGKSTGFQREKKEKEKDLLTQVRTFRGFRSIPGHWRPCIASFRLYLHLGHGLWFGYSYR